jgi:hypothetical protein
MIAGLILGTLVSIASAFLLPVIFPDNRKPNVSRDLQQAEKAARVIQARLERVSKAVEITAPASGRITIHSENPSRLVSH